MSLLNKNLKLKNRYFSTVNHLSINNNLIVNKLITKIDLINFYKYFIIKLFLNNNFKILYYKLINLEIFQKNVNLKKQFLKYYFFGNMFFKRKLLFILKRRYLLQLKNNIKAETNLLSFENRYLLLQKYQNFNIYIKNWLLGYFLNRYESNIFSLVSFEEKKIVYSAINELNNLFFIKTVTTDANLISFLKYGRMLKSWLMFNFVNKVKQYKFFNIKRRIRKTILENNDLKIKNYRLNLFNSTFFLIISVKLNNVFLTLVDCYGKTIYKCSGGHFGHKGRKKTDISSIFNISKLMALNLKKYENARIFLISKITLNNKFVKSVLHGFAVSNTPIIGLITNYNRPISFRRLKKLRRV